MTTDSQATHRPAADKRRQPRAPLPVLRVAVSGAGRSFFGYAKNISRSGLFIATIAPREPGSCFTVELSTPNPLGIALSCRAEVVWQRKFDPKSPYEPGMGLKFLDLDPVIADRIAAWVAQER